MLEFEKKLMLSETEYIFLRNNRCDALDPEIQTNYYYDTAHFDLCAKNITCRIRQKGERFITTIKQHYVKHMDCSVESVLSSSDEWDDDVFQEMGLQYQGWLRTERTIYRNEDNLYIVLDQNHYLDLTDYELEIEYCQESESEANREIELIAALLYKSGIIYDINTFIMRTGHGKNKATRFFKRKGAVN